MEYVNLIQQIISAEQSAQILVQDAKEQESHLAESLEQEIAQMRATYKERADKRIAKLTKLEESVAKQDLEKWDKRLEEAMAAVEQAYIENKDAWVDALFHQVVGQPS